MQTSPEQVRQITESILARPEFREETSLPWAAVLNHFFRWLGKLGEWSHTNPGLAKALLLVLTVLLLVLLGHIGYTVVREFVSLRRRPSIARLRQPIQALDGIAGNWSDALQVAKSALQAGDVYKALWITHRILLSALDHLDLLKFARWKTNSDYLRECRARHPLSATLSDVTTAYERVIYAHSGFDRDEAARLLAQVEKATSEIGQ